MEEKYNYLESIAPLLLSHGMVKIGNVISCELSEKEKLLLLEFISIRNLSQNKLFNYIESVKNDTEYLNGCSRGEELRLELNDKIGCEWFVYDMYRLLNQLDEYLKNYDLGIDVDMVLEEYKHEEINRNSLVYENNGSISAIILSRKGIVIQ